MAYSFVLFLLAALLFLAGVFGPGWPPLEVWLASNFLALALAHHKGLHSMLGKQPDGALAGWSWVVFAPLLAYTQLVWHLLRFVSREPAYHVISEQLVVGRRLLPLELDTQFDNYVDLTAEFSEPRAIRLLPAYVSFPLLDAAAPSPAALHAALTSLKPGRTYIHCAQGHGRTGLFALALLLCSGTSASVDEGLSMLRTVRPGIRLNKAQRRCIDAYADQFPGRKREGG